MGKLVDVDNVEWGIIAFIASIIGLTVAVVSKSISETTFTSLFTPCLVGIGSLSNPNIKAILGKIKPAKPKALPEPIIPAIEKG